jgi:hypothetical protein
MLLFNAWYLARDIQNNPMSSGHRTCQREGAATQIASHRRRSAIIQIHFDSMLYFCNRRIVLMIDVTDGLKVIF